jgi:hypothetical protein
VIIPPYRVMNQSQDEYQFNHREKSNHKMTHDFSTEVHMLAGTLVPVVSTNCWYLLMQIEYEGFCKCIKYHCSILSRVF